MKICIVWVKCSSFTDRQSGALVNTSECAYFCPGNGELYGNTQQGQSGVRSGQASLSLQDAVNLMQPATTCPAIVDGEIMPSSAGKADNRMILLIKRYIGPVNLSEIGTENHT